MRVVGLGGGIGAARLWTAMARAVDPGDLTVVVNTADDMWHHGLRVCPDLDTVLYALSGRQDTERGWGVRDESWRCMDALRDLGQEVWFNLGDRDLATHLLRTGLLREGTGLAAVTARLAEEMGVRVRVLPMTEDEVTTRVEIVGGAVVHYEEFLVRLGALPAVRRTFVEGIERARPAPGIVEAIAAADLVVLGPSNPVASIAPILAVPGFRQAVRSAAEVVAVSPIVSRVPISSPGERRRAAAREKLMVASGIEPTAAGVAGIYRDLSRRFVLDTADADQADAVRDLGPIPVVVPTLLHHGADPDVLAGAVMNGVSTGNVIS